jgi:ribulose bisphosphate carboxylase small subunit
MENPETGNNVGGIAELRAKVQEQEQSIRTVLGSGSAGGTEIFGAKKISLIFWEISKSFHLKRKNSKSQRAITPSTMV